MNFIHLQGLGKVSALPVEQLQPGQKLAWNYSYGEYVTVSVTELSPQFMTLTEKNLKTEKVSSRKVKKGRLIGIAG